MLSNYLLIGFGVYLALTAVKYKTIYFMNKYSSWAILKGIFLTITLWPIALWNNKEKDAE